MRADGLGTSFAFSGITPYGLETRNIHLKVKGAVRRFEKLNLGQMFHFAVINSDTTPDDGLDVLRSCPHKHRSAKMTFFKQETRC